LGTPRWGHQALLVHDDSGAASVVVVGGKSSPMGGVLSSVEHASFDAAGALGAFSGTGSTSLPEGRAFFDTSLATAANSKLKGSPGRIWLVAGIDAASNPVDTVLRSDIGNGGSNGSWTQIAKTTNSLVAGVMTAITNNTLFMVGGAHGVADAAGG